MLSKAQSLEKLSKKKYDQEKKDLYINIEKYLKSAEVSSPLFEYLAYEYYQNNNYSVEKNLISMIYSTTQIIYV